MKNIRMFIPVMALAVVLSGAGCDKIGGQGVTPAASAGAELYAQAQAFISQGKTLEGKALFQQIMNEYPDFKDIEKVQQELYDLNMRILLSNMPAPETVVHEVQPGDTLGKIARQYNVTMELIRASNNIRGDTIRVGQKLRIWTGKFSLHVDKSQNILMLKSNDEVLKVYQVSTGANNTTPVGTFRVTTKLENPVWFKAGAVIPPESPDNVLGTRWMGFNIEGYGIHGTVDPDKIGQQVTAGCVRMRNEDVEQLYTIVPRDTEVVIVD